MPFVKISKDAHKDMKQYLVDVEGLTLGELIESAFEYAMQNLHDFEQFLELEADQETEDEESDSEGSKEEE
jgi:hypothetical protein